MMTVSMAACGKTEEAKSEAPTVNTEETISEEATDELAGKTEEAIIEAPTVDRAGNSIVAPNKVDKIVSMAPATTQILIELGLGEKIIAIDTFCKEYDGLTKGLPRFDMMTPDVEALLALEPDIVFATGMSITSESNDPFKQVADLGVCVAYIPSSGSIEAIKEDIKFIADMTGTSQKGKEIVEKMEKEIKEISDIGKTIPDAEKKTVYFELADAPSFYSFGTGVYLNEMIELIGAKNAFGDQNSWIALSEEAVINANPDVILTNNIYTISSTDDIKNRAGWDSVTAVVNNDIHMVDSDASSLPNQNIVIALREMANAVYPQYFSK